MAIKAEEALKVFGIEDLSKYESTDDFKTEVEKEYIRRSRVLEDDDLKKQFHGLTMGKIESEVKNVFKGAGIDFSDVDLKGKKISEIATIGIGKITDKVKTYEEELEELRSKGTGDEALKRRYENLEKQFNSQKTELSSIKEMNAKLSEDSVKLMEGFEMEKKSWKVNHKVNSLFDQVKFKKTGVPEEAAQFMKQGFRDSFLKKYKFDLDDKEELVILSSDGKPVGDKVKVNAIAAPFDVLKHEAMEAKVWEENPNSTKTWVSPERRMGGDPTNGGQQPRKVHPNAAR